MKQTLNRGRLVQVQIGPGRYAKMYEQDAIKQGLIQKVRKPAVDNKMVGLRAVKAEVLTVDAPAGEPQVEMPVPGEIIRDDFTEIEGIGRASRDALYAHGVNTFDDLLTADVSFLSAGARAVVDGWKKSFE